MSFESIRAVFRRLDQEIWVVTTADQHSKAGLVATLVNSASIVSDLPRVLVGLSKQHQTTTAVCAAGTFVLNLLSSPQTELAWSFGLQSGHTVDKWQGNVAHTTSPDGDPVLEGTSGWLTCRLEQRFDVGDRWLVLAEVLDGHAASDMPPLTISRLLETATTAQREQLLSQQQSDAQIDAKHIRQWRQQRSPQADHPEFDT